MCTGKCSKFIAISLYVLAAVSVICNIILFFPDFETKYAAADRDGKPRITEEVKYMGGLVGGGIMVLVPAIHIHLTSAKGCCANRCGVSANGNWPLTKIHGAKSQSKRNICRLYPIYLFIYLF
uniref:Transmembrane 4 L six family member 21b n=1 Tax=Myripristis murdjan TaxID=586833 RepID=A0A667ZJH4_9TELE